MQHHVWDMTVPPHGTRVIQSKWVFKNKLNAIGEVERYKARLVAKGFTQRAGIDYDEVWAPVGKHTTFRALLAVAAAKVLELHQMDVKTAFLHGELEETIWMQPPEGYVLGPEGAACRLKKSLSGLKQASWYTKLKSVFSQAGLMPSRADSGLFIKRFSSEGTVYVLVWVDDLNMGPRWLVDTVRSALRRAFDSVDLGPAKLFLGMELVRTKNRIALCQAGLIRSMPERNQLRACRSMRS
jgi:hypothetical protein